MIVSVVILNWNGADMLRRYLPSVLEHTTGPDIEVVVADNGSTDDSVDYLKGQPVRLMCMDTNYGFAEGYNRAIASLDSKYVVLLNSDVEVTAGWWMEMLQYMESHVELAAVQPKILSWTSKEEQRAGKRNGVLFEHAGAAGGLIDRLGYPFCRGRIMTHVEVDEGQYDVSDKVFWTSGACMMVRRSVFEEVGGLDADFFAHQEEIDLCWRMQCRGWQLMSVPSAVVYHLGGGSLHYSSPRKTYLNFRNNLLLIYKNMPSCRMHAVLMLRFWMDYLAAMEMLLTGQRDNAAAVRRARWDFWRMRPAFRHKRRENRRLATVSYPDTIARRCIVMDYYIRHIKQ